MLRVGQFSSSRPLSKAFGFDRGTPIDRYYIENFLSEHSGDIRGRVLEVGDDSYSRRFGGDRIGKQDVLHVDDSNPAATIVGDLASSGLLPASSFDCMILTQTLQYVFDLPASLAAIHRALRPGGAALITAPAAAPIGCDQWADRFYWRFSVPSMERLLAAAFDPEKVEVVPLGNLYAATAFLHGAAVEEVNKRKLQRVMPEYAVIIAARAVA
jgi:SAM-dependent methyltransferase